MHTQETRPPSVREGARADDIAALIQHAGLDDGFAYHDFSQMRRLRQAIADWPLLAEVEAMDEAGVPEPTSCAS